MREFLSGLFEVSLTMGAVTALLLILSPAWKRRFRPQWRCWAWLLVALRLAVPFNVSLPRAPVVLEAPAPAAVSAAWVEEEGFQGVELTARTLPPGEAAPEAVGRGLSLTTAELAFAVWAAVAAGVQPPSAGERPGGAPRRGRMRGCRYTPALCCPPRR